MPFAYSPAIADLYDESDERKVVLLDSEQDDLPRDRIRCSDLVSIADAWLAMPREEGEALPRWSCLKLLEFKHCIEKLCVISVKDWEEGDLEFSLYGNHPTEYIGLGRPLSLQTLRHDPKRFKYFEDIRTRVGRAVEANAPQYARKTLSWNDHGHIVYEVLMLPFMPQGTAQRILQPVSAFARRTS